MPADLARPAHRAARLAQVLMLSGFAVAGGSGAVFLAVAFAMVAGGEVDPMTWGSGVIDVMMRQSVGAAAIAIGVSLGVGALAQGAFRLLYVQQLAREAESEPDGRARLSDRQIILIQGPFFGTWIYGVYFLVFGGIAIIIFALALGGGPDDPFSQFMLGAAIVLTLLMAGLMALTATAGTRAWNRATARILAAWGQTPPMALGRSDDGEASIGRGTSALRRVARRTGVSAGVAAIVASATFMIGLHARQPCLRCEERFYDEVGENAIDVLMTIAIPFSAFAVVVALLSLITLWLASVREWVTVARLARARADAPDGDVLDRLLYGWWPGSTAGVVLVAIGWGAAPVIIGADLAAPGILSESLVPVLLVVGAVGVVVLWWAVGAAARSQNRLREAWRVSDIAPPPSGKRSRKRKNREHPR